MSPAATASGPPEACLPCGSQPRETLFRIRARAPREPELQVSCSPLVSVIIGEREGVGEHCLQFRELSREGGLLQAADPYN
jgi:hypothetical protein